MNAPQNFKRLGSLVFRYKWFRFDLERGLNRWGPALRVSTIISDQMPPVLRYKFITSLRGLKTTYFHSFLINDGSDHGTGHPLAISKRRYWAGHHLDFHFVDHVRFAAMETIVYGNRGLEQFYWFPVTTHYIGDMHTHGDDNPNIAFDAIFRALRNIKLYPQFHISELVDNRSQSYN